MKPHTPQPSQRRSPLAGACFGALVLCTTLSARAQTAATPNATSASPTLPARSAAAPDRVAEADRAFKEAGKRMDAGDFASACPLLEHSQALDPSSGTLLNLGDCYEHVGRTASAWRAFAEARALAAATGRPDRADVADARAARLAPVLASFTIVPPTPSPNDLVIRLDDTPLASSTFNAPLPVDPGNHTLRASAAGMREYSVAVPAPASGLTTQLVIPPLQPVAAMQLAASSAPASDSTPLDSQQIGAIAAGSVGVVGVALGTVFGLRSMAKHNDSDANCPNGPEHCNSAGVQAMEDARSAGNISTISFVLGGLGLGVGAVLWFARPFGTNESAHTALKMGPGSLTLEGTW